LPTCSRPEVGDDAAAGVRWRKPSWSRYGSYTSSIVSPPRRARPRASRGRPGPPPNFSTTGPQAARGRTLEACLVDLEQLERLLGDLGRDRRRVPHLGDVADAAQDAVRDPRRAARAARDLVGGVVGDLDAEDARAAAHDRAELAGV
jgi:hypothetical protein